MDAEATDWVRAKGSARLQKALELDLLRDSMGVYRAERLAIERRGWRWLDKQGDVLRPIHNPSEEALDLLAEARLLDEEARLVWLAESPVEYEKAGPVVRSTFLGRDILLVDLLVELF
jgi:hypothetical protein